MVLVKRFFKMIFSFNLKYVPFLLCSIFSSFTFYAIGSTSNQARKNEVASLISNGAKSEESGYLNLNLTRTNAETAQDYYEVFNLSNQIKGLNFNRTGYKVFPGYSQNNQLFSENYEYTVLGKTISVLPSPVNSINLFNGRYSHEIWGGDFMFPPQGFSTNEGDTNFCYIPKEIANALLINLPAGSGYDSLIGQSLTISFIDKTYENNSQTLKWTILNIFDYDEKSYYLYDQFGLFICCYNYLPSYNFPSIYIQFGRSLFTNRYYLDWLNQNVNFSTYSFEINRNEGKNFNLNKFTYSYFNYYSSGLEMSLLILCFVAVSVLFLLIECLFCFTKHRFKTWIVVFSHLLGICIGMLSVYAFSFMGFGLSPISTYFSATYLLSSCLAFLIVKKYVMNGRKRCNFFEIDKIRI